MASRLWEDPDFQPSSEIMDKNHKDRTAYKNITWLRPGEIVIKPKRPMFIVDGATRFDLNQGEDGDCWFLAAIGCLAVSHETLLNYCIQPSQSFDRYYTGRFQFRFWDFGEWRESQVDDRLPTRNGKLIYAQNKSEPNEFWVPLLEKAYAKLKGGYDKIDGGNSCNALVDFTGGISETVDLRKSPYDPKIWDIMTAMMKKSSLMACSIRSKGPSAYQQPNGLCTGHAYSILHLETFSVRGQPVNLLHLRNPWGHGEWNGMWSDRSLEWLKVPQRKKDELKLIVKDDGEFWISFRDFITNFDFLRLCHLEPSAEVRVIARKQNQTTWSLTKFKDTFDQRRKVHNIRIDRPVDDTGVRCKSGPAHVIVSLMQNGENATMALELRQTDTRDQVYAISLPSYHNERELTRHYEVSPGHYEINITTETVCYVDYLLRVYYETSVDQCDITDDIGGMTIAPLYPVLHTTSGERQSREGSRALVVSSQLTRSKKGHSSGRKKRSRCTIS